MPDEKAEPRAALAHAVHLVGGLLLGAGLVALARLALPLGAWQPMGALLASAACLGLALLAARRSDVLAEALCAAALAAAASVPFFVASAPLYGAIAALLVLVVTRARGGRTALAIPAALAALVTMRHGSDVDLFAAANRGEQWAFLLATLLYGALLLAQRRERWASRALALWAGAIVLAILPVLDGLGVVDAGLAALLVALALAALFALGLRLGARGLVAGSGALLAVSLLAVALLAAGPLLVAAAILLLGGALAWGGDAVRSLLARTLPPSL